MKKIFLISILFFTISSFSQNSTEEKLIYDFIKEVVYPNLDKSYSFISKAIPELDRDKKNRKFLTNFLIKNNDSNKNKTDPGSVVTIYNCLTDKDVESMLMQQKKFKDFTWDTTRLGFNNKNNKKFYMLSLPVFSEDKQKALIRIEVKTLDGEYGTNFLYIKKDNVWTRYPYGVWQD